MHAATPVPGSGTQPPVAQPGMPDQEIDRFLLALGAAVDESVRASEAAERRRDELTDAGDAYIERSDKARPPHVDCEMTVSSIQVSIAVDWATRHRRIARELAAWWADAAVAALTAAATGTPVSAVRMGAANPQFPMDDHEVDELPEVDKQTRQLVEFSARLGPAPRRHLRGEPGDDLLADTLALASRGGLLVRQHSDGELTVSADPWPEGRRRRMWGDHWIKHHIPRLPGNAELTALLTGASNATVERLRAAARTVVAAVAAEARITELGETADRWTPEESREFEALCEQVDGLTARLAAYARLVTDSLPEVRAAAAAG
ncbi:hypothetical protein RKE29_01775 [Streptomyces sp. B1866]|uniref:hypothetical protein n=1 Tax=Streptomyces sp. B1866 TaxID=3075431 RepID=UPI00288C9622|nr:hypothetical protein [Streptomyces sp. B1866]MDT3395388.1 hypothetical protein [Streptomyces sp. B1866]